MPRRNTGPRLKWLKKRDAWYIIWYEAGRERSRATGTTDQRQAEEALADFLRERRNAEQPDKPGESDQVMIADVLDLYGSLHAPNAKDPARIAYAIDALLPFWGEKRVSEITKQACGVYGNRRRRAPATIRRELSTLRAALNFAVSEKRLSQAPAVVLPEKPAGKDRWLTRSEAARLLNVARTAYALIDGQPVIADFVFSSRPDGPSYRGLAGLWRTVQRTAAKLARSDDVASNAAGPLDQLTLHSLRHSFAGTAESLGATIPTIAALLGHRLGGVTGGYILKRVDVLLLDAANRVADHIVKLMRGEAPETNIVQFVPRGRRQGAQRMALAA